MLNRCEFIGRLGRDPESRTMQDGGQVVNLSIGCSEKWRDKNTGEQKERTEWIRAVVFNDGLCKVIQQYCKKGDLIRVVGAMQTRKWTDQSGIEKYSTEIVLQKYRGELTLLGGSGGASDDRQQREQAAYGNSASYGGDLDSEIPF